MTRLVPVEQIECSIRLIRGLRVMLDYDLADIYQVEGKVLLQAVRRHSERFPEDFMFQLNNQEVAILRSQFVTSRSWGGRRYNPHAFTEQGIAMLSGVLNSERAIQVNIEVMRAFVRLRGILSEHRELAGKLRRLEEKYDARFKIVFDAIRKMMEPPKTSQKQKIGFDLSGGSRGCESEKTAVRR